MVQLQINLSKIQYNAKVLLSTLAEHDINFTPVIKCVAGDKRIIEVLKHIGLTHFAEARIDNINKSIDEDVSFTMIRTVNKSELEDVVLKSKMSIQTEITTIRQINEIAKKHHKKHQILLMIDWKDAREGILTYDVIDYIQEILTMHNICLSGLAFNFMCFNAIPPNDNDVEMINQFVASIENEAGFHFKIISGGNSSMLPQMFYNNLGMINDLRIGETLFRGTDTTTDKPIATLFQDAITMEAEIVEIKPRLDIATGKNYLQAILDIGYLDTYADELVPLNNNIQVLGATSDHVMVDLQNCDHYQVGDTINFALGYRALAQSMYADNIPKKYVEDSGIQLINEHFIEQQLNSFN
ncbi:alanine racemase [Staphylococcus durrellii]|uniref:alanine racemase n=1 Tax=Staphylococcus durrellii TaxID=2781773 RepID=UPI0018A04E72|nr:alanine racemase [Staphylococcus durrellii]MBF7016505.1 alanine racemase [Staphylococcus durrellii]